MNRLKIIVACTTVLLLYEIKGFDCDNTTLLIPTSKYGSTPSEFPYGGLSPSQIASFSFTNPVPQSPPPVTNTLINTISTSPYLLSSLPPSLIYNFLNVLTSSPWYLQSVEPSIIISLIDTLCSSSSLLKDIPDRTLVEFITAITLCPKINNALPPSLTFCLLRKIQAKNLFCSLSPAVKVTLLHSLSSPETLNALKPTEISFLINVYQSTKFESPLIDILELLNTISSSPTLKDNIPISQIICFLHQISLLAPSLVCAIPPNVINDLLAPIVDSIHNQCPVTLVKLIIVITSSPNTFNTIDPLILSSLLFALSQPNILSTVPPTVIVKLLTDISLSKIILKTIKPEAIINILYAIKSVLPNLLFDVPPSVRSTFVFYLASIEVTGALSIQANIKLIDTLCNTPYFLPLLPSNSINKIITCMVSNESLLNTIPLNIIVDFVYNTTILSPILLRETSPDIIQKLLLPLTSMNALSSLSSCSYSKLLYSLAYFPLLINSISDSQIINILNVLNLSPSTFKEIPSYIYINILTQIFTTPELLSKIPFTLLLNFLQKINDSTPKLLYKISPSAITAFMDFFEKKPATLISLSPKDIIILIDILTKVPSFLTHITAKTLNVLFDSITASSTILDAIPIEMKIKLIRSIHSLCPAIFSSLLPKSIHELTNSFNSFEVLSGLCPNNLIELTTTTSECPYLLSALDYKSVTNLLDVLSTSPSTLKVIKPRVIINLISTISLSETLSMSIPISSYIRFLQAILCFNLPQSVCAVLLNPLQSLNVVKNLTSADFETVVDTLKTSPRLLAEIPQTVLVNLLTAIPVTFTSLPYMKTIALLNSIHLISPSLLCVVPENVLRDLLKTFSSQSELNSLPSEYILALITVLSSSPCLLNTISASTLENILGLLSLPSLSKSPIPSSVLENFFTKLSLTSLVLKDVKFPLVVAAMSALSRTTSLCTLPPSVAHVLLVSTGDDKTIYELRPTEVMSFISIATTVPSLLNALAGPTLNKLLSKVASSPHLLTHISPSLMTSFVSVLTSAPAAFNTVQPTTVVNLMTTIALHQPSILSALPCPVASELLGAFNSPQVFASLPPPVINNLVNLLSTFPNMLTALPVSPLNSLLSFLSASPTILGTLPTCTLVKFLTVLTSVPSLLGSLSPSVITSFLSTLSAVSPKFLCILPPSVVTAIISAVTSGPALASATPSSIASLILTLNRSSCLIPILPMSVLISFLTYLPSRPNLLSDTPGPELVALINNVQSPGSIRRVVPNAMQCASDRFDDFTSFQIRSPALSANEDLNITTSTNPKMIRPMDDDGMTVYAFPGDNEHYNSSENSSDSSKNAISLIPKLLLPDSFKGADVYILPSNNKQSPSSAPDTPTS